MFIIPSVIWLFRVYHCIHEFALDMVRVFTQKTCLPKESLLSLACFVNVLVLSLCILNMLLLTYKVVWSDRLVPFMGKYL